MTPAFEFGIWIFAGIGAVAVLAGLVVAVLIWRAPIRVPGRGEVIEVEPGPNERFYPCFPMGDAPSADVLRCYSENPNCDCRAIDAQGDPA